MPRVRLALQEQYIIKLSLTPVTGKGAFIDTNKIKESDLSFMITVKVVNKTTMDTSLTKLAPVAGMKPANFTDVFGDSFISGR